MVVNKLMKKLILLLALMAKAWAGNTVTLQIKRPNHSLLLKRESKTLEFRPNASLHWGIKVSGDYYYAEYGGKIKDTNYSNRSVGNNSYKSYRLGIPIQNFFFGLYYQEWEGFSSDENNGTDCDYCLDRPNLLSREGSVNIQYALNSSFSMKALNSNGSDGVSFANSWIFTGYYDRNKVRDAGGLLQGDSNSLFPTVSDLQILELRQLGLGLGHGLLYPFGNYYLGLSGLIGVGYQDNRLVYRDFSKRNKTGVATHWNVKVNIASQGKGFNYGVKGYFFANLYSVAEDTNFAGLNYNLYLYTSYSW